MDKTFIRTLKPNVSREQARAAFCAIGPAGLYWRLRGGPLKRMADVYVPFAIYTVRYQMGRGVRREVFAMDAVDGSLDLFRFAQLPAEDQVVTVATRNALTASLDEDRAQELLRSKVLRIIFQQGFFKLRDPQLEIRREALEFHLPYWLGFYGRSAVRCRVLDAVRRRFEGAKASHFFEAWLAA